jgi:hypothetical protein
MKPNRVIIFRDDRHFSNQRYADERRAESAFTDAVRFCAIRAGAWRVERHRSDQIVERWTRPA